MKKLLPTLSIVVLFLILLSSCESYIEFEKMRFKWYMYFFFGSLLIGLIGLLFSNDK